VLDSTGHAIAGKVVTFSTGGDTTAYFTSTSATSATTDANGVATATLNIGSNMTNRTITVSATADAAVGTTTVKIVGTTITISGNTSLSLAASTALTISVKNSAGVAVPGATLTVASLTGNTIVKAPATGITDANGQIVVTVTATSTTDTITVTGAGATQTHALTITAISSSFSFTAPVTVAPATTPEIVVNTAIPVTVLWTNAGAAVVGSTVNFYTSRGTITASAVTDVSGIATASINATSTGATIFTAAGPGNTPTASLNVVFVTNTASTVTVQANPSTIGFNTSGSQSNQSVISVVVRDAALNLVKNANVGFTLLADPSGGSLSSAVATTNIAGTATVNFLAGSNLSSPNGEQIQVTVDSVNGVALAVPITTTTGLTVTGQAIYVRLQTDNTVGGAGTVSQIYTKQYLALVTDSAGHAVPDGTLVYFTLHPTLQPFSFFKGTFIAAVAPATGWVQSVTASCANEDTNLNGFLDVVVGPPLVTEDTNGNGFLDPEGVALVNNNAPTVGGYATATITYSKNYAGWVVMDLEARTQVTGNDPPAVVTVPLVGAAADYSNTGIAPPGMPSPFGQGTSPNNVCTNTL
jgi:hypothetical protein